MDKYKKLLEYISSLGSAAVAFSGGVDSTLLLYAAKEALGEKAVAVTANAPLFPEKETAEAMEYSN
ncbi:MAG: TIGR00268 family protein, partial [Defluviitaleaceae bacterium]|nr:TIGR00268 family protein [Defluviitaleaceae bacterium]